jgi:predicted nucleic acid-binding Zn ribbon protein
MQRASRVLGKLKLPAATMSVEKLACAAWPCAVGKTIAAHTHASRMVRTRLIVEVEDQVWRNQLFTLRHQILRRVDEHIGPGLVEDVEFRVIPRRLGPQRAESSTPALEAQDDADGITDPVLRRIYKAARTKARA